jgi:hypothetical protein
MIAFAIICSKIKQTSRFLIYINNKKRVKKEDKIWDFGGVYKSYSYRDDPLV